MRDITGGMRAERRKKLQILIDNYNKALKKAKNEETKKNLKNLIAKAQNEMKDLK